MSDDPYEWVDKAVRKRGHYRSGAQAATTRENCIRVVKVERRPVRFNSGPTKRHAVLDFMALCAEFPEAWERA